MRIIWTPMGLESLSETSRFIGKSWNEEVVDVFIDRLENRIEQLKKFPEIGPVYKGTNYRQLTIHPLVSLYYEVDQDFIYLVLVWANKQDPNELKRKLDQF